MSRYRKVQPGEPMYEMIEALKADGKWVCDASTHNSNEGCSYPDCFKYQEKRKR